ncbi:uncharacterized protein E0L32_005757 [Thyridium curvatum]|uniref:Heterokaryon incompatibility domain-containing protein n=1 Tax=Thyridium curvatum TaxID=1093900 RepID=A0A507B1Q7_9PEZI|nr:uncharacterized protein E0L32_005757 [Thyridium curvatum]TPX13813.1 hypothetical protein E0L32_005757 [Thyridium curvatum]
MRGPLGQLRRRRPPPAPTAQRQLPPFTYEPLPDPQNNIRLIEIHPGADDGIVSCTLTSWSIPEAGNSGGWPPGSETDSTSPTPIQATDQPPSGENRGGNASPPTSNGSAAQKKRRGTDASRKESSLPPAPPYYAVSYTWGRSPKDTTLIHINGQEMKVRKNCDYVLRQARWCGGSRFFWVDAICINQADMDEKSHQVAMMGSIFTKAQSVMACVGPHHDDSEMVLQILAKHQSLFYMASLNEFPPELYSLLRRWRLTTSGTTIVRLFRAVLSLLRRQYFTRLWIFQELYLARSGLILCCGEAHQPFALAFGLRRILDRELCVQANDDWKGWADNSYPISGLTFQHWAMCLYQEIRKKDTTHMYASSRKWDTPRLLSSYKRVLGREPHRTLQACLKAYSTEPVFKMLQELALEDKMMKADSLGDLLRLTSHLNCEDRRDKVYGLLSVVDWQGPSLISPDYKITPFQLALRILGSGNLDRLFGLTRHAGLSLINQSMATLLVGSLGLCSEDCREMKTALGRRRYDQIREPEQGEQGDSHHPLNPIEGNMAGLQIPSTLPIDPSSATIGAFTDEAGSTIALTYIPNKPEDVRIDWAIRVCLPAGAQAGDWILVYGEESVAWAHHLRPGLLVRKQQGSECYSIIGHALLKTSAGMPWFTASFHVEFSPEDYLVYGAQTYLIDTDDALPENLARVNWTRFGDLLNSSFCGAAQSSTARFDGMLHNR